MWSVVRKFVICRGVINKLNYVTYWSGNAELLAENYWEQQHFRPASSVMIFLNISTKGEQVRNWKIKFWPQNERFFASCNFRWSSDGCIIENMKEQFLKIFLDCTYLIWRVKIFLPKLILGNCWIKEKLVKALIVKTGVEIRNWKKIRILTLCPISS